MFELNPDALFDLGVSAVTALVVVIAAFVLSGWAGRTLRKVGDRTSLDPTLTRFFSRLLRWVILLIAGLFVLGEFGIETASFAVILGAAGLAIGMALQGTLGNIASGVMLLLFRPFKVGDVVRTAGETGKVYEIDLFATALDTPDNRRLIVPNGRVFGDTIENITFHPTRRVDVVVGVEYSASLDGTRKALETALAKVKGVLDDPTPAIVLTDLGASSVDWVVRAWAKREDYWSVKEALTHRVKEALDESGIGIPFPQMDVHVDGAIGRPDPPASD